MEWDLHQRGLKQTLCQVVLVSFQILTSSTQSLAAVLSQLDLFQLHLQFHSAGHIPGPSLSHSTGFIRQCLLSNMLYQCFLQGPSQLHPHRHRKTLSFSHVSTSSLPVWAIIFSADKRWTVAVTPCPVTCRLVQADAGRGAEARISVRERVGAGFGADSSALRAIAECPHPPL